MTVNKWIPRKRMPAHKAGRLWKFKLDEVDDWIRSGQASSTETERGDGNQ